MRARLFSTSGKTAVYPQLFGVQGNGEFTVSLPSQRRPPTPLLHPSPPPGASPQFIADWPALSDANENKEIGQLEALLAGVARRRSVVE